MRGSWLPEVAIQRQNPIGEDYWHSIAISAARGLAAVVVAAAHLRAEMYPGLRTLDDPSLWFQAFAFATGFAHQAVLVFFVISGWLVGGSLLQKMDQRGACIDYAIDRVTRLWTVLIPTFVLTVVFGLASGLLHPGSVDFSPANEFSAVSFVGNLLGLQSVVLDEFGGNYALWSLANETWYYIAFPLLVLLFTVRHPSTRIASLAGLALLGALLPVEIVMYFAIWLLGVAFSRIRIACSGWLRCAWLLPLLATSAYFRLTADNDRFDRTTLGMDFLLSLMFLALLASLQFRATSTSALARPLARTGQFFAEFSFSLYVLHLPLIFLLQHLLQTHLGLRQLSPEEPLHFAIYLAMLGTLLFGAYLSYLLFESRTYRLRRVIKALAGRRTGPMPATATAPVNAGSNTHR